MDAILGYSYQPSELIPGMCGLWVRYKDRTEFRQYRAGTQDEAINMYWEELNND